MKKHLILSSLGLLILTSCNFSEKKTVTDTAQKKETVQQDIIKETALETLNSQDFPEGKAVYDDLCITCHMPNGQGVSKTFPPLAKSDYLMTKRQESIYAIKYGLRGKITVNGKTYNSVMAPLGLSDKEIANVTNYITNSWSNKNKDLITENEVSKIQR